MGAVSTPNKRTLLIAGGGTGGHLFPGIAVAEEWCAQLGEDQVVFLGSPSGMEASVIPQSGYPFLPLESRRLKNSNALQKVGSLLRMPIILLRAARLILQTKPVCVLGVGGYVSGPAVLMAALLGVPSAVAEQNARPGLTNRLLARWVKRIYTAFPEADFNFPVKKVRQLGNPVRHAFMPTKHPTGEIKILILGGSQGAVPLNRKLPEVIAKVIEALPSVSVVHQSGRNRRAEVVDLYHRLGVDTVDVVEFIDDMAAEVKSAHLVIGRSGATTVAELAAVGRAAYFIPFPFAADDHQAANASSLVECGAARMIREADIDIDGWSEELITLLQDENTLVEMGQRARQRGVPDAAQRIVSDLRNLASIPSEVMP